MSRREVPGTGLSIVAWSLLLCVSIGLFLAWGGLLWKAPRQASHVMRFVVSYLTVVPLALLALRRRWSWPHFLATVGTLWSIKMLVTATLYLFLARGVDADYQPILAQAPAEGAHGYAAAETRFPSGKIEGRVTSLGAAVLGAAVWIDDPRPGLPNLPARSVEIDLREASGSLLVLHHADSLTVHNQDGVLHTVQLSRDARLISNRPLVPGGETVIHLAVPGLHRLRCGAHPEETAWILVADHPYATTTGADGRFVFSQVPAGPVTVEVIALISGILERSSAHLDLSPDATAGVEITLGPRHASREVP
jgi:hypothetical protein